MPANKTKFRIHLFVITSSIGLGLIYAFALADLQFFFDPSIRWRQLIDLIEKGFRDVSCTYPALEFDPEYRFLPAAYVSVLHGQCYYWFSYATSFVFAPIYWLFGNWGIPSAQLLFSGVTMYCMAYIANLLGFSWRRIFCALILFRCGTANLLIVAELEDHTLATALFMGGVTFFLKQTETGRRSGVTSHQNSDTTVRSHFTKIVCTKIVCAGILIGLASALRPEMALMACFVPVAVYFSQRNRMNLTASAVCLSGCALALICVLALNYWLLGHALGIKVYDPANDFLGDWQTRLWNLPQLLFFDSTLATNGMLFQMPLLLFVPVNLFLTAQARRDLLRFLLLVCTAVLPLLLLTPLHLGGPYIGFRFAGFLYPLLILLAVNAAGELWRLRSVRVLSCVFYAFSLLITIGMATVGGVIYRDYRAVYRDLQRSAGDVVVLRDSITVASLYDEYYRRPVLFVPELRDCEELVRRLRRKGVRTAVFVRHRLAPQTQALLPAGLKGSVIRELQTAKLEIVTVRLE